MNGLTNWMGRGNESESGGSIQKGIQVALENYSR